MNRLSDRLKGAKLTPQQRGTDSRLFLKSGTDRQHVIHGCGERNRVSNASIIRFARAIGYLGFTDLKNDIYNSDQETSASVRICSFQNGSMC